MRIYPGYPASPSFVAPSRREFLRRAVLGIAGGLAAVPVLSACGEPRPKGAAGETEDEGGFCDATAADIEGPYYKAGAPQTGELAPAGALGQPLVLTGVVQSLECTPLAGAVVDVWHADHDGAYDDQGFAYRGKVLTGADGRYRFDTIYPGQYGVGGGRFRPSHVHFKVSYGGVLLTTQLYFEGDAFLEDDPWAEPSRTIALAQDGAALAGVFDVTLELSAG